MAKFTYYIEEEHSDEPLVGDFDAPVSESEMIYKIIDLMGTNKFRLWFEPSTGDSKVEGVGWHGVILYAG